MDEPEPLVLEGLGSTIGIEVVGPPPFTQTVRRIWHRCLASEQSPDVPIELHVRLEDGPSSSDGLTLRHHDPDRLLSLLTRTVTRKLVGRGAGSLVMLHAAGLSAEDGRSMALVAPGGMGKTTLARLLGTTLGYLTDETVAITPTCRILAYPKPLSVRIQGRFPKDESSPDDLGLLAAHPSPQLAALVLLDRDPAWRRPELIDLGLLDAVEALARHTSSLGALPDPLQRMAELIGAVGGAQLCRYSEAVDVVPMLCRRLEKDR